jgi:hypothetical protein
MVPWAEAVGAQTNMQTNAPMTSARALRGLATDREVVRKRMGEASVLRLIDTVIVLGALPYIDPG